jgi:hypothetical protein
MFKRLIVLIPVTILLNILFVHYQVWVVSIVLALIWGTMVGISIPGYMIKVVITEMTILDKTGNAAILDSILLAQVKEQVSIYIESTPKRAKLLRTITDKFIVFSILSLVKKEYLVEEIVSNRRYYVRSLSGQIKLEKMKEYIAKMYDVQQRK